MLWFALPIACSSPIQPASAPDSPPLVADWVLDGVVLVTTELENGKRGYGAGILRDDRGTIVTNLHVVSGAESIAVMFRDPRRPTYSPLDGGLDRLLFENDKALMPARVVRSDPSLDIAVLEVDGPVPFHGPFLQVADGDVRTGERIYAVGHPDQSVWTITSGVVSGLHSGVIQHDAPLNTGSSGGPLVDEHGGWLGVNTMKLLGGAEGMAYARPASLVDAFVRGTPLDLQVDRSDVVATAMAYERGLSLAREAAIDTFTDWEGNGLLWIAVADEAATIASLPEDQHQRFVAFARSPEGLARWRDIDRATAMQQSSTSKDFDRKLIEPADLWPDATAWSRHANDPKVLAAYEAHRARIAAEAEARAVRHRTENHMIQDISQDDLAYREARKRGIRIEEVVPVGQLGAWIRVAGRNDDGSMWTYSECWRVRNGRYSQPCACLEPEFADALPTTWPPPIETNGERIDRSALKVAASLLGVPEPVVMPDAVTPTVN